MNTKQLILLCICYLVLVKSFGQNKANVNSECSNILSKPIRFKSIDINRHTGSVGFVGQDDDQLYYCALDYHLIKPYLYNNSKISPHIRTHFGYGFLISTDGYGPLSNSQTGIRPVAEFVGDNSITGIPKTATFVSGDVGTGLIWYIDADGMIKSSIATSAVSLPKIKAQQFTVFHNQFYALDANNMIMNWQPGFTQWKSMNAPAKVINRDHSVGTQLYYIGMDDALYQIMDNMIPTKISDFKCKYLAVNGRQLHVIGLDGLYYVKMRDCWERVDFSTFRETK